MDTAKELFCTNILKDGELRWVTRNIKNWAESTKYEHYNIKYAV